MCNFYKNEIFGMARSACVWGHNKQIKLEINLCIESTCWLWHMHCIRVVEAYFEAEFYFHAIAFHPSLSNILVTMLRLLEKPVLQNWSKNIHNWIEHFHMHLSPCNMVDNTSGTICAIVWPIGNLVSVSRFHPVFLFNIWKSSPSYHQSVFSWLRTEYFRILN